MSRFAAWMSDAHWKKRGVNVRRVALSLLTAAWGISSSLVWAQCDIQVQSQGGAVQGQSSGLVANLWE